MTNMSTGNTGKTGISLKLIKGLILGTLLLSGASFAVPYAIPQPSAAACRNDAVLQELTDNISNGTLKGEQNLLASMNFVQSCQDLLYPEHRAGRHSAGSKRSQGNAAGAQQP